MKLNEIILKRNNFFDPISIPRRAKRAGGKITPLVSNPYENLVFLDISDPAREARRGEFGNVMKMKNCFERNDSFYLPDSENRL